MNRMTSQQHDNADNMTVQSNYQDFLDLATPLSTVKHATVFVSVMDIKYILTYFFKKIENLFS